MHIASKEILRTRLYKGNKSVQKGSKFINFGIIERNQINWEESYGCELQDHDIRTIVNQGYKKRRNECRI
jgi:hypothetical protein